MPIGSSLSCQKNAAAPKRELHDSGVRRINAMATLPFMSTFPSTKKVSPIVYFIGFTAALAGLLFGLDVGVISGAQIYIQRDLGVNDQMIEWIVSALLWGAVVGALGSGILCKKTRPPRNPPRQRTPIRGGCVFLRCRSECQHPHHRPLGARSRGGHRLLHRPALPC